jgi:ABC-2 type transport system permease protein
MTPLTPLLRAFRSEVLKCRRWSMFAGTGIMLAVSAFFAYLTFHQITFGATGQEVDPLAHAFPTELGLITVVGQARSFIIVVALIMVTANLAAEWSQGTWRNLLVREPRRLRLLAGKMLALMLFVLGSMMLTLVASSVLVLVTAGAQGVQTAAWTSSAGLSAWLAFFGNEVLCLIGICLLGMLIAILTRGTAIALVSPWPMSWSRRHHCDGVAIGVPVVPDPHLQLLARLGVSPRRWSHSSPGLRRCFAGRAGVDDGLCRGKFRGLPTAGYQRVTEGREHHACTHTWKQVASASIQSDASGAHG